MLWNKTLFTSLNVINGKPSPCGRKGILRHCHYCSDPILGLGIVATRIIPLGCHACITILYIYWDSEIKESFNQPIYAIKLLVLTIIGFYYIFLLWNR